MLSEETFWACHIIYNFRKRPCDACWVSLISSRMCLVPLPAWPRTAISWSSVANVGIDSFAVVSSWSLTSFMAIGTNDKILNKSELARSHRKQLCRSLLTSGRVEHIVFIPETTSMTCHRMDINLANSKKPARENFMNNSSRASFSPDCHLANKWWYLMTSASS